MGDDVLIQNLAEGIIPLISVGEEGVNEGPPHSRNGGVDGSNASVNAGSAVSVVLAAAASAPTGGAASVASAAAAPLDDPNIPQHLITYPATCFITAVLVTIFAVMWHKQISPTSLGSSYRQIVLRFEWWKLVTSVVVHSSLLHLAFNVAALWRCRTIEAQMGSAEYLLASLHLAMLAKACHQAFEHVMCRAGGLNWNLGDGVSVGYSGVVFAWMAVVSLMPDAATQTIVGLEFGSFTYVLLNLVLVKLIVRRSSFIGHIAGVWAGLVFSAGTLNFLRTRYWGAGFVAWVVAMFLGSLAATTGISVPFVDFVDIRSHEDLGIGVEVFDWSSQDLQDYVMSNA